MEIGIYGLGDMGKMYARYFSRAGHHVVGCDLPERRMQLEKDLGGCGVEVLGDGREVSERAEFLIYAVETSRINDAVSMYGEATRNGAIVGGSTSVKTPEIQAFEAHLPKHANIVTFHSLHGPALNPKGQLLAVIRHRSSDDAYEKALNVLRDLGSDIVELPNYQEHDRMTADTQAVTHLGFLSMGTAWKNTGVYPWENPSYRGGIDNVKILMALRVYGGKPHVYSGLAMLNPFAINQARQYANSVSDLFKMMIQEDKGEFRNRLLKAGEFVFNSGKYPILLDDEVMGEYALGETRTMKPNSHLSLWGMIDAWHRLGVNPYDNLICQTPPFRLRLGIAEYLFRNKGLRELSLRTAIKSKHIRGDDLEFDRAVREWTSLILNGRTELYDRKFEETRKFFVDRIPEAMKASGELIKKLSNSS